MPILIKLNGVKVDFIHHKPKILSDIDKEGMLEVDAYIPAPITKIDEISILCYNKSHNEFYYEYEKKRDEVKVPSETELLKSELTELKKQLNILPPISNPITLEDYKINKIYELSVNCNQHILNGFYSDCRGEIEFYSFSELDQTNIMGYISMLNSDPTIPIIWKSAMETLCTPFTKEQMIQLAKDGLIHKQENIYKFELLRNQVIDLTTDTIEKVEEIIW